jgi:hypothetical protein
MEAPLREAARALAIQTIEFSTIESNCAPTWPPPGWKVRSRSPEEVRSCRGPL